MARWTEEEYDAYQARRMLKELNLTGKKARRIELEDQLQDACENEITRRDGAFIHLRDSRRAGWGAYSQPDLISCIKGVCYAVELKAGGNKPTMKQLKKLATWKNAGAVTAVLYDFEEFIRLIKRGGGDG